MYYLGLITVMITYVCHMCAICRRQYIDNDRPLSVVILQTRHNLELNNPEGSFTRLEVYSEFFAPTRIRTVYLTDG